MTTRVLVTPDGDRVAAVDSPVAVADKQAWALVATALAWRLGRSGARRTTIALTPALVEPFEVAGWTAALRTLEKDFAGTVLPEPPADITVRPLDADELTAFVDAMSRLHRRRASEVGLDLHGTFEPAYLRDRHRHPDDDFLGGVVDGRVVTRIWATRRLIDEGLDLHVNAIDVPDPERGAGLLRPAITAITAHYARRGLCRVQFRLYAGDTVLAGVMGAQGYDATSVTLTRTT
ncbi:hypothetical protein BH09ACT12_BH09ACT12_24950 [soil metagenome]